MYLTEGFVFLITGLQARTLIAGIHGDSLPDLAGPPLCLRVVIVAASYGCFPRHTFALDGSFNRARRPARLAVAFALAFTGVRGVVSLAAALASPHDRERRVFP